MDITYFQKINNTYKSKSRQETDLYLLNKHVDECFADTIDYHIVKRNGEPFELIIIKDTDGNTYKKKIKSKHNSPFNLGDYIEWNNQIWLVTTLDTDEKTYHSGYMYLCTLILRWQNSEGKIVERYAYSEDFTKYSNGITGNNTVTIGDNQYGLTIGVDEETKKLKRDMRFAIDFDDAEHPDIYSLTNRKAVLSNYLYFNKGGTIILTMSLSTFNKDADKKVTIDNGKSVWICDYNDNISDVSQNPNETNSVRAKILGEDNIKLGFYRTYTVEFENNNGLVDWNNVNFRWDIACEFDSDKIISERNNNNIKLYVEDEDLFDEKIKIRIVIDDNIITEKILHIK